MVIKVLAPEMSVTTANTVYDSIYVRVYAAALSVVTIEGIVDGGNTEVLGSFTMPAGSVEEIKKGREDTISGTTALLCTPIGSV